MPFSVVCFRAHPERVASENLDAFNERLLEAVNQSGDIFLSHTRVNGMLVAQLRARGPGKSQTFPKAAQLRIRGTSPVVRFST